MVATSSRNWDWQLGLASLLVMSGAIATSGDCTLAQIKPDNTLGSENSTVTSTGLVDSINGGATRGSNLFHSFEQFSVLTGRSAHFNNALDIQNIISRVTGSSISNIDGLLRANGTANLFLLNPNGIIFGPNAVLNIGGSILASTASSLNFADGTQFSATAPQATPLLTVSVPLGLQFGATAGSIRNLSQATNSNDEIVGLQVQPGKTLALVGGDVRLDGGSLQAPGGRVELGGVAESGTVGLNVNGSNLRLSFPVGVRRADVSLTNGADVNVSAGGGGSIAVNVRNLDVLERSQLRAGIASGLGSVDSQAGDITLNAIETITVGNESLIANEVRPGVVGNSGEVNITTGSLSVIDGAFLSASTFGHGNPGSVIIDARDTVSFDGGDGQHSDYPYSGAYNNVFRTGVSHQRGYIHITTGSLSVTNSARLVANTYGRGNAGNVIIDARDTVVFDGGQGDRQDFFPSRAASRVEREAEGQGGNITVLTGSLFVTDGAYLTASTNGMGNAGNVTINARDRVSFDRVGPDRISSGAYSQVLSYGKGQGGNVTVSTGSLSVTNGAFLAARTYGMGNAGNIAIDARDTVVFDGGYGEGRDFLESRATSRAEFGAEGQAGNVNVTTGSLSVTNGAFLTASTEGMGNAGSVTINARDRVSFDGVGRNGFPSGAYGRALRDSRGQGGNVTVTTGSLSVTNAAVLSTSTRDQRDGGNITLNANTLEVLNGGQVLTTSLSSGNAGNIIVNIADGITLAGSDPAYFARVAQFGEDVVSSAGPASGLFATTTKNSTGQGGNLKITTGQLIVRDTAEVTVSSEGTGNAGNLEIASRNLLLDNRGVLRATTRSGEGGNITVRSQDLLRMRHNSGISTEADGTGNGGNIDINTDFIVALPNENSDITANAFSGSGGRIDIRAQGVFGIEPRSRQELQTSLGTDNPNELDPSRLPSNDITAISRTNPDLSGEVTFSVPDVDPTYGLVNLPVEVVDVTGLIAQVCPAGGSPGARSKFIVTGRGGLPDNPSQVLSSDAVWVDLGSSSVHTANRSGAAIAPLPPHPTTMPLVEATGWMTSDKGEVVLTAHAPTDTSYIPWMNPPSCNGS